MNSKLDRTALITGASRGLGRAIAGRLGEDGWKLIIDARGAGALESARKELSKYTEVSAIVGNVSDKHHLDDLAEAVRKHGGLDLIVNRRRLGEYPVTESGSAEMPSAGRAFSHELITELLEHGIGIAPLILHTGVASLESHEPPYEEQYRVPAQTADMVNRAREGGKRVVAVGTTVVRALETVTDESGRAQAGEGWTDVVVTPVKGISSADGLLTGFHEPSATHLSMLEALGGRGHLQLTYAAALREKYLWHEFGDLHLILP